MILTFRRYLEISALMVVTGIEIYTVPMFEYAFYSVFFINSLKYNVGVMRIQVRSPSLPTGFRFVWEDHVCGIP